MRTVEENKYLMRIPFPAHNFMVVIAEFLLCADALYSVCLSGICVHGNEVYDTCNVTYIAVHMYIAQEHTYCNTNTPVYATLKTRADLQTFCQQIKAYTTHYFMPVKEDLLTEELI